MDWKNKKELTFLTIGILILFIVILSGTFAIGFIINNLDRVFSAEAAKNSGTLQFEIEKAEKALGI
jgi:hypothetical protein